MTPLGFAVVLTLALPLLGLTAGSVGVMILSAVAALVHVSIALSVESSATRVFFLGQIPTWALLTAASLIMARKLKAPTEDESVPALQYLANTKARHVALKSQVAAAEMEENTSLQIYALAKSLAEALSWKDMAPRFSTGVQKIFGSHEFLLYSLKDGRWESLHRRGSWSKEPPVSTAPSDSAQFLYPPQTQEVVPVLQVPILSSGANGEQMTGLLFLKNASERPEADLVRLGNEFGRELGMALSKALLFNQMETHSRVDGLTGVLRRQAFMDRLEEEVKKANAFHSPFCLFMIDIDHFKSVNDGHGHAAGDAVLSRVGQILKESIYETDVVGRYGGEEFIILLPHAQLDGAMRKAESIRQRFEREVIVSGFERLRVTVSIGLSHFPTHGRAASELIARADAAMYQAKESGRNRVIAA